MAARWTKSGEVWTAAVNGYRIQVFGDKSAGVVEIRNAPGNVVHSSRHRSAKAAKKTAEKWAEEN